VRVFVERYFHGKRKTNAHTRMTPQEMIQKLIIQEIEKSVPTIPEYLLDQLFSIKYIAQEFRGKTLEIFDVPSGKIVDVFTFEPVEIRMQIGRLDLIFRDDAGACYHCEEQRHMTYGML